ncbi:DUF4142 domain-containing protein [Altererythrobacter xixiisoli]|uniref:DUF4142 domain-containing protein n=1 Tax=Croceibacterium xixiisoli TaxID=1476466 RepID=A0A6I4TTP6_9SPHN|nr:DUF4142 domain-containing protein [Croceibacterium xixiisoli]MXO98237.1 DUF4142 domain-containing protein [Croceibacterium xixiisoli]
MKLYYGAALAACLLAGCGEAAAPTNNDTGNNLEASSTMPAEQPASVAAEASAATNASGYLAMAGAGDLFEIESSRAILAKQPDQAVADFARSMVDAHQQSTAKLKKAATDAGLTAPAPALEPDQQAKLDSIKSADGEAATTAYLTAQREAHTKALALHQNYAEGGDAPALKTAAGEIASVVQHHIDMLAKLPGA